uniref:Uncharacterized protein TCIL3000_10_6870 n=1 Tax=Trypanosoma congolense (strain IL3000) TaxID=1068625 RepID=G0UWZ7_TRYCI|nr:unnamed protein product [Trypanosoma congolense IL3000]
MYSPSPAQNANNIIILIIIIIIIVSRILEVVGYIPAMFGKNSFLSDAGTLRDEKLQRRESLRRRRVEYIAKGNKERAIRSEEELRSVLRHAADDVSFVERNFRCSIDEMSQWWDIVSGHVLKERHDRVEAERLQTQMNGLCLSAFTKREVSEQISVMEKDERRLRELEEFLIAEDRAAKEEVVRESMQRILRNVDQCIIFLGRNALSTSSNKSLLTCLAIDLQIRLMANMPLLEEQRAKITFEKIFSCHPFSMASDSFLVLLHTMYKMWPVESTVTRFDICRKPLFLVDGPKFSGKSLVSQRVAEKMSLLHISDRDLVNKALQAYRTECEGQPVVTEADNIMTLPYLVAHEEQAMDGAEVMYHSEEQATSAVAPGVPLSPWAAIGKAIEEDLLCGKPVEPSVIVKLMKLQMGDPMETYSGVLFDGAVAGVEELQSLELTIPPFVHPFDGALDNWPTAPPAEISDGEPLFEGKNFPKLLVVQRDPRSQQPAKTEGKVRPMKRGVDPSMVPPPVLPEITCPELTWEEMEAIEKWEKREDDANTLFSAMVYINCGTREIFNRFAGLRVDKETGEQYHMIFCPPPPERVPHVVNFDRTRTSTTLLHRVVLEQRRKWDVLRRTVLRKKENSNNLYEVDGEQAVDGIVSNVARVLSSKQHTYETNRKIYEAASAAMKQRERIKLIIEEQMEQREAERKRLIKIYTECGVPIPTELDDTLQLPTAYPIPDETPALFFNALSAFASYYFGMYAWAGSAVDSLVNMALSYRSLAVEIYDRFWNQPDGKQGKMDRFISNYNSLPVYLLGQVSCKNELHLLLDQLRLELFGIVETSGKEAISKIDLITKRDLFLGPWSTAVCNVGIATVQGEVERFLATINMTLVYFSTVINEPCIFDELDTETVVMRATADGVQEQAKGKDKKAQNVRKPLRLDDTAERSWEETFVEAIAKLVGTMTGYVEKLQTVTAAPVRGRDNARLAAAAADEGRLALIVSKCVSFAHEELAKVQERIAHIRQFFTCLIRDTESYCAACKENLLKKARSDQLSAASAVNTAIYVLRNAIEKEEPIPPLHLGRQTFSVIHKDAGGSQEAEAFVTPVPRALGTEDTMVHRTLSTLRLIRIVETLRTVAPDCTVAITEFSHIVRVEDYAGAQMGGVRLKTKREVFDSFDPYGCGFIDWREFVLHLMLWCTAVPNTAEKDNTDNYYIRECSIEELLETKAAMGVAPVGKEAFLSTPFFFFAKDVQGDRLKAYAHALWLTFSDDAGTLNPMPLLAMMCADRQPVRGAQKAFAMFSSSQDGLLTQAEMNDAFHMLATNPRSMCLPDAFSGENIDALYHGEKALSFTSVCDMVMGRSMLNSSKAFLRKSFVVDESHVNY